MHSNPTRRAFIKTATAAAVTASLFQLLQTKKKEEKPLFRLSLAQWSLHRAIRAGKIRMKILPKSPNRNLA